MGVRRLDAAFARRGSTRRHSIYGFRSTLVRRPGVVQRVAMRSVVLLISVLFSASLVRADRAAELALIHAEAIGGMKRITALKALRATGHVVKGGSQVRFTLLAARPASVRIETERGGRTLVQATDGVEPPWEFDTGKWPPQYQPMNASVARTFQGDAEFDDPLLAAEARGFTLEYAGEMVVEGRKLLRVLVTRKLSETFSVLLDDETFLIVMRVEHRESTGGRRLQLVTHYEDFRPVDGVLMPHTITQAIDGKATQQTKIARIEANPELSKDAFTRPKVAVPAARGP